MKNMPSKLDRRQLLKVSAVGASGLVLAQLLAACGEDDSSSTSKTPAASGSIDSDITPDMNIVQRWVPTELGIGDVRLPFSLATAGAVSLTGPRTVTGKVVNATTGETIGGPLASPRYLVAEGTAPFWVFNVTIDTPDFYALLVDGGPETGAAVQVLEDKALTIVRPGDTMTSIDTPTVDDHRGVEPYCTHQPNPCPFHDVTLSDALKSGKKVVFLVGTPAHCQTGVCSPVLDAMVTLSANYPEVLWVHADVYSDKGGTVVAPTVETLGLTFEPVTWVVGTDGVISHRFEGVWDVSEIDAALTS